MQYLLTNAQMREADAYTVCTLKADTLSLMERAGRALAQKAIDMLNLGGKRIRERVLVCCGGGNNGGDGFVCARVLRHSGVDADVVFFAQKTSAECLENKQNFIREGGNVLPEVPDGGYAIVVDCLLGTGFHGRLLDSYLAAVEGINKLKKAGAKVLACDVPSGVNGDNGLVEDVAVCADETLCIAERKAGVYLNEGIDFSGNVSCADIGIYLPQASERYARLVDDELAKQLLPRRKRYSHKGSYHKAAIVAGSVEYTGAAYLATAACLRAGAGYTTLFTPRRLLPYYTLQAPEALLQPLCEGDTCVFSKESFQRLLGYDAVAYGMGMGVSEAVAQGAEYLINYYTGKLILDADALNSLAAFSSQRLSQIFLKKTCDVVITPHVKEFSRLTGKSVAALKQQGLFAPVAFAKTHKIAVLLKSAVSLISDGQEIYCNTRGNSGQAKGGSGDVLSGVIAGLCAGGLSATEGAALGAYITGVAAELAEKETSAYSLVATKLIEYLGAAFLSLQGN